MCENGTAWEMEMCIGWAC